MLYCNSLPEFLFSKIFVLFDSLWLPLIVILFTSQNHTMNMAISTSCIMEIWCIVVCNDCVVKLILSIVSYMVSDRHALVGGSAAGFVVDIALFPIDTIKTRMQSKQGLRSLGLSDLHKLKGVGWVSCCWFLYFSVLSLWSGYGRVPQWLVHWLPKQRIGGSNFSGALLGLCSSQVDSAK